MRLADLDNKNSNPDVILLQTPSTRLQIFLQDKLKRKYDCNNDSLIRVETKKDIKRVRDVLGITPPFAVKWFVEINLDAFYDKELIKVIKESSTCLFFCTCSKYSTFKKFKDSIKDDCSVFDYYINYLRRPDLIYLYDAFVKEEDRLSTQLFNFVVQGYSGDIEAIFDLLIHLSQGEKIKNRKDITDLCGLGSLTIESYVFSLIKPLSGSDKGLKKVMKDRINVGVELADSMGYTKMYNFMAKCLRCFIEIKVLCVSGVVYKSIRNLPDCYDEKSLARYQKYLWRLKEIPLSRLIRLRQAMGSKPWRSDFDLLTFVYTYYNNELQLETLQQLKGAS